LWTQSHNFASYTNDSSSPATNSSPTPTLGQTQHKPDTEVISLDDKTLTYINHKYNFSVSFPKYNLEATTCQELQNQKTGLVPEVLFEKNSDNEIYISNSIIVRLANTQQSDGGYMANWDDCQVIKNSIDAIDNGLDEGFPGGNYYPSAVKVKYATIQTTDDLENLAQSMYQGCHPGRQKATKQDASVYQVELVDSAGQSHTSFGPDMPECMTNFAYYFLYSPTYKVAVISNGFQDVPFNGSNGQSEPSFHFGNQ
jgi:hypothetical protein